MIIYNVTIKVTPQIHNKWLMWMKETHLPMVMNSNCFDTFKMFKVLVDESDGYTYAIQYFASSHQNLQLYQEKFAPKLRKETEAKFGDQYIAIRTVLEEL